MRRRYTQHQMKMVESRTEITESGSFLVPPGCVEIEVWVIGAGGGSGRSGHAGGGGAGGGQIVHSILPVSPGESIQCVIGEGGLTGMNKSGYVSTNGTAGGDSSFGNIIAKGGYGGNSATGSYSWDRGLGGSKYTQGGNGGSGNRYGNYAPTNGVDGQTIDGVVYGSSGGGSGTFYAAAHDGTQYLSAIGGEGAGDGCNDRDPDFLAYWSQNPAPAIESISEWVKQKCGAKTSGSGGGGIPHLIKDIAPFATGAPGLIILKYKHYVL